MKRNVILASSASIICAVLIWLGCLNPKKTNYTYLNHQPGVKYVGKETCRNCHIGHYDSFIHTGMGQSFGLVSPTKSAAFGIDSKPIFDKNTGMYYAAKWKNKELYIIEFTIRNGDTAYKRQEKITYIVGSGHHTNSHFWEQNGYLYQAPLTFYTQKGIWDLPPGFEQNNSRWDRPIEIECMSCHNAMPKLAAGTRNKYIQLPQGIDCERCHGPGEIHVKNKLAGDIIDTSKFIDYSIVNPKKLPFKLQIDICQRCHLQGNNVLLPGKQFTDFVPGMALSSVFEVYMPTKASSEFFMAGHADRFQQSPCFIKSNKNINQYNPQLNFTCINCHNPHVSVRSTAIQKFNVVCASCHQGTNKKACTLPLNKRNMQQNNCVKCHMPANNTQDIPHVTVHDHRIQIPNKLPSTKVNINQALYAVNTSKPKQYMEGLISWFEKFDSDSKYIKEAESKLKEQNLETQIHFYYVQQQYIAIANLQNKIIANKASLWTAYRMAKSLDKTNKLSNSLVYYQAAYALLPGDAQFAAEYANALLRSNQIAKAQQILQKILKLQAKNYLVHYNLALANMANMQWKLAKNHILIALQLNPMHKPSLEIKQQLQFKFL